MFKAVEIVIFNGRSVHIVRNFAEELSLKITNEELGFLPMIEADKAIDRVKVTAIHSRKLKRALVLINLLLERHFLTTDAVVTVVQSQIF